MSHYLKLCYECCPCYTTLSELINVLTAVLHLLMPATFLRYVQIISFALIALARLLSLERVIDF